MTLTKPHEGHFVKKADQKRIGCATNNCGAPAHWCEYSRFTANGATERSIAFYYVCRSHAPKQIFKITLGTKQTMLVAAPTPGDARLFAFREWFGPGVYWDSHEDDGPRVGRVVRQKIRKSHGKDRFVDEPLTKWVRLTVRKA